MRNSVAAFFADAGRLFAEAFLVFCETAWHPVFPACLICVLATEGLAAMISPEGFRFAVGWAVFVLWFGAAMLTACRDAADDRRDVFSGLRGFALLSVAVLAYLVLTVTAAFVPFILALWR